MSRFTSTSENVLLYLQVGLAVGAILLGCAYLSLGAPLSSSSKGETNQRKVARKEKKILKPKKKTKESDDVDVDVEGKVASATTKKKDTSSVDLEKLMNLPAEMILSILDQSDMTLSSVLELANSNRRVLSAVEQWTCECKQCNDTIFALEEEGRQKLVVREDSKPYSCVSCGKKFCGQETCDSNSYVCNGCEKMECRKCMLSHMENCPMCMKFDHHCIKCQGKVDNEKYCHLCGFNICKNHARKCDKCGLVTCGIHDYSVDTCSFCKKGFCSGCHSHGDYMWNCADCGKRSCNASGDGNRDCPKFVFGYDWPQCRTCYNNEAPE